MRHTDYIKDDYSSYEDALKELNLQDLTEGRKMLALRFSKKCMKHEQFSNLFPTNNEMCMRARGGETYKVNFATTSRLKDSSIPSMQRLLNEQ